MKTSTNQLILPLNLQYILPEDNPVILFNEICEQSDYANERRPHEKIIGKKTRHRLFLSIQRYILLIILTKTEIVYR